MRDEQLANSLRQRSAGNWKKRSALNRLQMLFFLLLDVVLVLTLIFFEDSSGFILIAAVAAGFIFFYMGVVQFPTTTRAGWKLLVPMVVGYVLMLFFSDGLLEALIAYAYMEFAAMTVGLASRWAVPMVSEMRSAGWRRIGTIIGLFFAHFGLVVWLGYAVVVEVFAFRLGIGEPEPTVMGVAALVAWIAAQVPLVRTRYDLAKKYDMVIGQGS